MSKFVIILILILIILYLIELEESTSINNSDRYKSKNDVVGIYGIMNFFDMITDKVGDLVGSIFGSIDKTKINTKSPVSIIDDTKINLPSVIDTVDKINISTPGLTDVIDKINIKTPSLGDSIDKLNLRTPSPIDLIDNINLKTQSPVDIVNKVNIKSPSLLDSIDKLNLKTQVPSNYIDKINIKSPGVVDLVDKINIKTPSPIDLVDKINFKTPGPIQFIDSLKLRTKIGKDERTRADLINRFLEEPSPIQSEEQDIIYMEQPDYLESPISSDQIQTIDRTMINQVIPPPEPTGSVDKVSTAYDKSYYQFINESNQISDVISADGEEITPTNEFENIIYQNINLSPQEKIKEIQNYRKGLISMDSQVYQYVGQKLPNEETESQMISEEPTESKITSYQYNMLINQNNLNNIYNNNVGQETKSGLSMMDYINKYACGTGTCDKNSLVSRYLNRFETKEGFNNIKSELEELDSRPFKSISNNKIYYIVPCAFEKDDCFYDALKLYGFTKADGTSNKITDACLITSCSYEDIDSELNKLVENGIRKNKFGDKLRLFMINNTDEMASKILLWLNLKKKYGEKKASEIVPYSWDLLDENDFKRFEKEYNPNKLYITKSNRQRQEGLKIHNNLKSIQDTRKDYVVVQELIQNPYIIRGRKINLRVYVLLIKDNFGNIKVQAYQNGFMYYTPEYFEQGNMDFNKNITTGYIDRQVYVENPLTHEDFRQYLDSNRQRSPLETKLLKERVILSDYVFEQIYKIIGQLFYAYKDILGTKSECVCFQLYGVDVAIDDQLKPSIMEVNKGPDLSAKDGRDREVKLGLSKDILKSVGLVPNTDNKFKTVLTI